MFEFIIIPWLPVCPVNELGVRLVPISLFQVYSNMPALNRLKDLLTLSSSLQKTVVP